VKLRRFAHRFHRTVTVDADKNMKKLTGCLILLVLLVAGILCAPFLMGFWWSFSARSHYNSTEPSRVSTFPVPDSDLTITLYRKARPRAICYEGEYRILEISGRSESNLYFDLLPASAGDNPHLKAYWYPSDRCLTLVESGMQYRPGKALVDLNNRTITHFEDGRASALFASAPSPAADRLQFPSANHRWSLELLESDLNLPEGQGVFVGTLEEPIEINQQDEATVPVKAAPSASSAVR